MFFVQLKEAPDYAVTDEGEVVSLVYRSAVCRKPQWKVLRNGRNRKGYLIIGLYSGGKVVVKGTVHKLVTQVFLGPRPDGYQVNHKNGIKTDNRLENLEYVSPLDNSHHAWEHGLHNNTRKAATQQIGERHGNSKLTDQQAVELFRLKGTMTTKQAAEMFGISTTQVCDIWNGKSRKYLSDGTFTVEVENER